MNGLRNPFGVKNGKVILINDLSVDERGLKCQCKCPSCDGEFIARMGDVNVHHFAHSKDACDEVQAYLSGMYRLIQQILNMGVPFYVPALAVRYTLPSDGALNEDNIESHIQIIPEYSELKKIEVSPGCHLVFSSADLSLNNKNQIQALELSYKDSKMAIKVMPPDTVCKISYVSQHKDMATLVLDYTDFGDMIHGFKSAEFQNHLLNCIDDKRWIYNPKVRKSYPRIIEISTKSFKKREELRKHELQQQAIQEKKRKEQQAILEEQRKVKQIAWEAEREKQAKIIKERQREFDERSKNAIQKKIDKERAEGFEQVKDLFTQQETVICDKYDNRWVQCEQCGLIKQDFEFTSYGGLNRVNLGVCADCNRKR